MLSTTTACLKYRIYRNIYTEIYTENTEDKLLATVVAR